MPNTGSSGHSSEVSTYSLANVDMLKFPVLVSVPHAGRDYPSRLIDNLNVPASHLLRLEDRYVDRLAASVAAAGFPLIVARKPRAWLDLNRSPAEIDPEMVAGMDPSQTSHISRKVRGGLGILPRRLHGAGNLWREKWPHRHVMDRIEQDHEPYHIKIAHILAQMQSVFGGALLLDLHSMPSVFDQDRRQIGFVIGGAVITSRPIIPSQGAIFWNVTASLREMFTPCSSKSTEHYILMKTCASRRTQPVLFRN